MNKQNWTEVEFAQALGMITNVNNPGRKSAQLLLNVHTHDKPGKLSLRPGYALKYAMPSDSTITNSTFLNFEMFMDKQADPDLSGQEVTCLIQKGTIIPISGSGASYTQNALCFWIRPYWNGSAWIDDWQWLNKIIITQVTTAASPESYPNELEIYGNAVQGLGTGALAGWTVYNQTLNQFAKIITSAADGADTRICHTLYNSAWALGNTIILMQNYYDLICLAEIYNCIASDIVFHKINDDLRIGFGGQANRTGISIGYRNKYYLIQKFDFTTIHPDLTDAALQDFQEVNNVVLDEFITDTSGFGMNLTLVAGAPSKALTAGTWYFRLTATLDNYEEMLAASDSIVVNGSQDVQIQPYMTPGKPSSKVTGLSLYQSGSGEDGTFYQINTYDLSETSLIDPITNTAYPLTWILNNNGQLTLNTSLSANNSVNTANSPELMTESNVTNIAAESDTAGSWEAASPITMTPSFVIVDTNTDPLTVLVSSGLPLAFMDNAVVPSNITYTPGYYGNGRNLLPPVSSADICADSPIPVRGIGSSDLCQYIAANGLLLANQYIVFYDSNQNFISAVTPAFDTDTFSFTIPSNTAYIAAGVHGTFNNELISIDSPGSGSSAYSLKVQINTGTGVIFPLSGLIQSDTYVLDLFLKASPLINGTNVAAGINYAQEVQYDSESVTSGKSDAKPGLQYYATLDFIPVLPNTSYEYSGVNGNIDTGYIIFYKLDGTLSIAPGQQPYPSGSAPASFTFTTPTDAAYLRTGITSTGATPSFQILYQGASQAANLEVAILDANKNIMNSVSVNNVSSSFAEFTETLNPRLDTTITTPSFIGIFSSLAANLTFWVDQVSLKSNSVTIKSTSLTNGPEMSDVMGYTPGAALVKGWDQALVFHGSTYFLNPYVDQRYDGFIYVSIINAANSFMHDIATADNYRELDTFESFEVIGMILLPTMELLILMNNCITAIDPDTGIARNPVFDIGAVSRESIVNINGIIFWCDDEDIYMLNIGEGLNPKPLLENTIRDLYQALADKNLFFCIRDQYNTYRLRTADTVNNTEFLLSKNGWIQEQKYNYPEIYRVSVDKKLDFLSQGNIYQMNTEISTAGNIITDDNIQVPSDDGGQAVTDDK